MKFEIKTNEGGEYYWRIVSSNGKILSWSEGYRDKCDALHAIELVKNHSKDAEVIDRSHLVREN